MDLDLVVFVVVLASRVLVPLAIFRFPLPAILASLVIDAADQTIFQNRTELDLEKLNYQGYDKALDIFYLTIAYISTYRNWSHTFALLVSAALFYYRLVGVTLFELAQVRALLIIFPNTFEYFFIFFAAVRIAWDTDRLSNAQVLKAAAAIWVFIKLPQEYWIHIAKLDTTDLLKEDVFGVETTDSWGTALTNRPLVTAAIVILLAAAAFVVIRIWRRLPSQDHPLTFDADKLPNTGKVVSRSERAWTDGLLEKIALIGLIVIIFGEAIPSIDGSVWELVAGVAIVVLANALLTQRVASVERAWQSAARSFVSTLAVNTIIFAVLLWIFDSEEQPVFANLAFLLLLLSLLIALFDRYRPVGPAFRAETVASEVAGISRS